MTMNGFHDPEFVVDRTVAVAFPENIPDRLIATQIVNKLVEQRQTEVRKAISDLLATATPFELKDNYKDTHLDVLVSIPANAAVLKEKFGKIVQESGFSDWRKSAGKSHIVSNVFGIMPDIQRFAMDRNGYVNLRDPKTFKISDENRVILAELFFPDKPAYEARANIQFASNKSAPGFAELVVHNAEKFQTEIKLGDVVYPLYSLESKEGSTYQSLDFVELSKSLEKKSA